MLPRSHRPTAPTTKPSNSALKTPMRGCRSTSTRESTRPGSGATAGQVECGTGPEPGPGSGRAGKRARGRDSGRQPAWPRAPSHWRWPMPGTSSGILCRSSVMAAPTCWARSSGVTACATTSSSRAPAARPFSRGGDGRAALGPVLREYIVSEAMAALGVPTTRALAAVTTGERVLRETVVAWSRVHPGSGEPPPRGHLPIFRRPGRHRSDAHAGGLCDRPALS